MNSSWSLPTLLANLHEEIEQKLTTARKSFAHPGTKGDASEKVWLELLQTYLPQRYQAASAHVVDADGTFSDQIDVVVFDRQYSPFIFTFNGQIVIPAESIYAAFEAKQTINATLIGYAQKKIASVRALNRTSLPIPHAGGVYTPKAPPHIIGGFLSLDSDWSPPLGKPLETALNAGTSTQLLDLGCIASFGHFAVQQDGAFALVKDGKPATAFLFELIARLQATATVPMIDIRAYARWLT